MSTFIVFQQMIVLFAMIFIGYFVYKKSWVDNNAASSINKIVVNIFNPVLIISSVLNKEKPDDLRALWQNLWIVVAYFGVLIILGMIITGLMGYDKKERPKYQMMMVFSNCGFMGIPVIRGVLGEECLIYVTVYIMLFNFLIYTYGVYLAKKSSDDSQAMDISKTIKAIFINPGVIAAIFAMIIYLTGIKLPAAVETFTGYVGNATIPLSMMAIGFSLARMPFARLVGDVKQYVFTLIKMIIIPVAGILITKALPIELDANVRNVFIFMLAMPVGSIVSMLSQEYGNDQGTCGRVTVITTVVSLVSIPVVAMFF